jgi:hypothetical protein
MKHWLFFFLLAALFLFGCCLKPNVPCLPVL